MNDEAKTDRKRALEIVAQAEKEGDKVKAGLFRVEAEEDRSDHRVIPMPPLGKPK